MAKSAWSKCPWSVQGLEKNLALYNFLYYMKFGAISKEIRWLIWACTWPFIIHLNQLVFVLMKMGNSLKEIPVPFLLQGTHLILSDCLWVPPPMFSAIYPPLSYLFFFFNYECPNQFTCILINSLRPWS